MRKTAVVLLAIVAMLAIAAFAAPASATSSAMPPAQAGAPIVAGATTDVETCTICHKRDGASHQTYYDQLYQDGVIKVTDVKYAFKAGPDTTTVTFKLTKNGQPMDPAQADALNIYWVPFKDGKFQFEPVADRLSLKGKVTADAQGMVTSTLVELAKDDKAFVDYTDVSKTPGLVVIYGRDETVARIPGTRVDQNKYPFAAVLKTGTGVDYVSSANDAGCVKCHTDPYLKHGYIYAQVDGDPTTDFLTCKACHLDNGAGGHFEWQLLVDNPTLAAEFLAVPEEEALALLSDEQKALYAYTTSVMNDVHMSHAMEFPYPQSMANCVTCHEGKLDKVVADANFTVATCKSCHPVTGAKAEGDAPAWDTTGVALATIVGEKHPPIDWANPMDCTTCHGEGKLAPGFSKIHSGYDKAIYTADGLKYSDAISVTIQSATLAGNKLNVKFSAGKTADVADPQVADLKVADIKPTVLVSMYGWDTKDFLVGGHERSVDTNKDGKIDRSDQSDLETVVGVEHPRIKTVSAKDGAWEVEFDLTDYANRIKDGSVKRLEVGVLPALADADGVQLALNAKTRTFDLGANKFDDKAFSPIATAEKCESCHAALATNFHQPSYGGSVTACRMCHVPGSGAAHLEMQSRSLDSYVHAIHSGQAFDVAGIDFKDPVQALHYEHHISMPYPTHANTNCESCHVKGTYNAPDQSESLPGLLSAAAKNETWDRKIGAAPSYVTGPAERACGGCHRAALINEDKAGNLAALNQHMAQGGYLIPAGDKPVETLMSVVNKVMALFK